jgi:pyridoxine 5-phosphate synthase
MMRLYVNVDHVATVRQARRATEPDPAEAAALCEAAGADGITVHLREDRRHIRDDDVWRLAAQVRTVLNLELAAAPDIVAVAAQLKPHQATFVPERREEIIRLSLFVTPDLSTLDAAARLGVDAVELHTGAYANAFPQASRELAQLLDAARHAREVGLAVHAGHGLTYRNVHAVAALAEIEELNIGHSIVSRAIMVGMTAAVAEMRAIVNSARVDQAQARS